MKINSCDITSFGKFKNYKIDFSDGLNVIFGENEAGKSTVTAFIKMMFYGYSGKMSDIEKNPRKKYMPWDASLMGGSIDFTHGGKNYRLTRQFKGSNVTDKISLTDTDLGAPVKLGVKGDIGSEIFGLSEAAFEKTLFIGSLGAPDKNSTAEGEINGKLSNIASTGDEDVSVELVSSKILKAKEVLMSRSGRIGLYDKTLARLEELSRELFGARETELRARELETQIAKKEREASVVKTEGDRLFGIMKKADLFKKRANLTKYTEAFETEQKLKKALLLPDGSLADKTYSDRLRDSATALELEEKALAERQAIVDSLKSDTDTLRADDSTLLDTLKKQKAETESRLLELEGNADKVRERVTSLQIVAEQKPETKPNTGLVIAGLILALVGGIAAALTFRNNMPLFYGEIGGAVIGLVLFLLGFVLRKKFADTSVKEELVEAQDELDTLLSKIASLKEKLNSTDSEINTILIEKGSKKALLEAKLSELYRMQEGLLLKKEELLSKRAVVSALCEPFGHFEELTDALEIAEDISRKNDAVKAAEVTLNLAADSTNCQSYEEAKKRLDDLNNDETLRDITPEEAESAKDKIRTITAESGRIREELTALRHSLRTLIDSGRTVPVIELDIEENKVKLQNQKEFCDAADIAIEVLSDSFAAMRRSFGSLLETETSKIFSGLTDGAYTSVAISKDLDLKVNKENVFGAKEWQFLSAGTTDQAYLSLRLALAKLMEDENDTLPLVMDDPFTQYDDTRSEAALKFLSDYSATHQLILFTCHSKIKETAKTYGATIKEM